MMASRSRVNQARANYYPQVSWSSTVSRAHPAGGTGLSGNGDANYDQYKSEVNLNQTLYDFGKTPAQVGVQKLQADASQADLTDINDQIAFGVKQAYYALLQAGQTRAADVQSLNQYQQHLESARKFFEVGVKAKIDVTKAEVDLSQAKLTLLNAENALTIARLNLNNAMGLPQAPAFEIQDIDMANAAPVTLDEALQRGNNQRSDLRSARAKREAAERSINLARTGYYPVLSGNAGYGWSGQDFPLDKEWTIGAGVSVPLFSGFLTRAQVDEAQANLASAKANEELVRQTVGFDIAQAFANLSDTRQRIILTNLSLKQATENRELAEGRYTAGVGNSLEVADALALEVSAKTTAINAHYDYQIALAKLARAMGERE